MLFPCEKCAHYVPSEKLVLDTTLGRRVWGMCLREPDRPRCILDSYGTCRNYKRKKEKA